jgi:hypothetical protein
MTVTRVWVRPSHTRNSTLYPPGAEFRDRNVRVNLHQRWLSAHSVYADMLTTVVGYFRGSDSAGSPAKEKVARQVMSRHLDGELHSMPG